MSAPISFDDLETMSRTIWGEARGEPHIGIVAVAHVILNRWKGMKWYSEATIAETCRKPKQFSCWNEGDPNLPKLLAADVSDPKMRECIVIALEAIAGTSSDPTKRSTHYHASDITPPPWAATGVLTAEIGRHLFYRDVA